MTLATVCLHFEQNRTDPTLCCAHTWNHDWHHQVARSLRITEWARRECAAGRPGTPFVLEGTMADPRWLDGTVDPNDRGAARWCYLGDPEVSPLFPPMPSSLHRGWREMT